MKLSTPVRAAGVATAVALALAPSTAAAAPAPADTVLRGGTIRTFDADFSVVRALAIRDGRIVYAGDRAGARRFIGRRTTVRDLRGRTVMPGLNDAHIHVLPGGEQLVTCNLEYDALTDRAVPGAHPGLPGRGRRRGPGRLARRSSTGTARRWSPPGPTRRGRRSTRWPRSGRSSSPRATGTRRCVNSTGLALAGITAATPDPPSGRIDRDAAGEPTGILEDAAARPRRRTRSRRRRRRRTRPRSRRRWRRSPRPASPPSATSSCRPPPSKAYKALHRKGRLTLRLNAAPNISVEEAQEDAKGAVERLLRLRERYETGRLRPRAGIRVRASGELFQDGVLQAPAQTASLLAPYFDAAGQADRQRRARSRTGPTRRCATS